MGVATARIRITGPNVDLDTVVSLADAEAITLLILTYKPPLPSFTSDVSLAAALELHNIASDRERVLVVLEWLRVQGVPNAMAADVNAALRTAGAPELRYTAQALTRCADTGACTRRLRPGIYEITARGQQRLKGMRDARSSAVRDHVR
jgi:hypothetical protein